MNRIKRLAAVALSIVILSGICVFGSGFSASAKSTGAGLAEYALNAYYSGWSYVWGGASPGAVDCSGLIWSYCGGNRTSMLSDAQANGRDWGYVSNGIPRVHGLGLSRPGHVGVYIEDGMEVDARGSSYGVCYQAIGGWNNWSCWFKLTAVSYPTTGWEKFNGNYYYYEGGQYIVNTSRTIDGTTYYFDSKGRSSTTPSNTSSSSSSSSSSNTSATVKKTSWSKGDSGSEVTKIQKRLAELGYYNGAIDGDFGDGTDKAFRAFQKTAGLYVDGIAGSDRDLLYADSAPYAPKAEEPTQAPTAAPAPDPEPVADEQPADEPETVYEDTESEDNTEDASSEQDVEETPAEDEVVTASEGDFSDNVADVQARLAELGYFGVESTGFYGEYTTEAIKNFQFLNGLDVTGELDEATAALLFSEDAVAHPNPFVNKDEQSAAIIAGTGPVQITSASIAPSGLIVSNETNQTYADTAASVAEKTNKTTEQVLAKSNSVIPAATVAQVKRSANVWIWFVLVAMILGVTALVFVLRDRKHTRYERYSAKKKRTSARAQLKAKW